MKKYILNLSTRKNLLSVILCGAMVCGIMTGCGDNVTAEAVNTSAESQAESQAVTGTETAADTAEANAETAVETTAEAQQETVEEQPADGKLYLTKETTYRVSSSGETEDKYSYSYQYDENGNQIKKWRYSAGNSQPYPYFQQVMEYENDNNVLEETWYDVRYYDNTSQVYVTHFYPTSEWIIEKVGYDPYSNIDLDNDDITPTYDTPSYKVKYLYDGDGNVCQTEWYDYINDQVYSLSKYQTCSYDAYGNYLNVCEYTADGILCDEHSYSYEYSLSNCQIVNARDIHYIYEFITDGYYYLHETATTDSSYTYDDAGNVIEIVQNETRSGRNRSTNENYVYNNTYIYSYTYDESGYLIEEQKRYSGDDWTDFCDHTVYEYDTLENLLAE